MSQPALASAPTLTVIDGKPTTLSTELAHHFGKNHRDVLRAVENLLPSLTPDTCAILRRCLLKSKAAKVPKPHTPPTA